MLPPGTPGAGLTVDVYDVSPTVPDAQVSQDMFLLEPTGTEMIVSERIVYNEPGKLTYLRIPTGLVKFYVPTGVTGPVQVRIQAPQGMPITRPAEKGKSENRTSSVIPSSPVRPTSTSVIRCR